MNNPSQAEANRVLRVLAGKRLKYTVRVYRASGVALEFQSDDVPHLTFDPELRQVMCFGQAEQYDSKTHYPMFQWLDGDVITCEVNPKE